MNLRRLIGGLLAAVLLLHCSHRSPADKGSASAPALETIQQRLEANYRTLQTLNGQAILTVESPEASYTANARIWFRKPDSLYIKVEAAFGIDVGRLFIAANRFVLFMPRMNLCYYGDVAALPLDEFLSVEMRYDELMPLLFGQEDLSGFEPLAYTRVDREWLIAGERDSLHLSYRYDPSTGAIRETRASDSLGVLLWSKTFDRFTRKKNLLLPQTIRLQQPGENRAVGLFYNHLAVNDKVVMKNLSFSLPANVQRIELKE